LNPYPLERALTSPCLWFGDSSHPCDSPAGQRKRCLLRKPIYLSAARILSESSEVKAFAQQMVNDHGGALTKVQAVAQQKGVTLPTEPDAMHKTMAANLEKQSGDAFDKMYMENAGTKDHQMVLSKLQSDAKMIKDPDVKALADAHTPVVEQHLKSAQQINK